MVDVLNFLQQNGNGIFVLFLILFGIGVLLNYGMWLLGVGRFSGASAIPKDKKLNFVITEAAFKLINDFRHLLALILVVVFSAVLGYAVYISRGNVESLKEALQAVMATLGGLAGSIIGYYFGEARSNTASNSPTQPVQTTPAPPIQTPPGTTAGSDIVEAPQPPNPAS